MAAVYALAEVNLSTITDPVLRQELRRARQMTNAATALPVPAPHLAKGSPSALADRIGAEQVAALFRTVTLGVSTAAIAAVILSAILYRLGHVDTRRAIAWSGFIILCA